MNANELKKLILSITQDVVFEFHQKTACINPFNKDKFEVGYDNKAKMYTDIDVLMNDKFFDGFSLNDISDQLEIESH